MYENPIMAVGRTGRIIRGSIWFLFVVFLALVGIPFVVDSDVLVVGIGWLYQRFVQPRGQGAA